MLNVIFILKRFASLLKREHLDRILLSVVLLVLIGTVTFDYFEKEIGLFDALWWSVVTMTTVGYGDIAPQTPQGRIIGMGLMIVGIGFLGVLTATIASSFIESRRKESRGMKGTNVKDHFVVCGWNFRGPEIVAELRADPKCGGAPIVVIAELEEKPMEDENLYFIRGAVQPDVLEKARAGQAQAALILSDDRLDAYARDAKTILSTLTIKSLYPDLYTCVELMDQKNIEHCHRAKADEVIVVGELSTNLLVQAALDHGITQMITELVSNRYGSKLFKVKVPPALRGKTFLEALEELKRSQGILCLAVESHSQNRLIANPDCGLSLSENDHLIVIASERPELQ